jgi:hypothetical protein
LNEKQHLLSAGAQHFYTTIHFFSSIAGGVKETEAHFHVFGANQKMNFISYPRAFIYSA